MNVRALKTSLTALMSATSMTVVALSLVAASGCPSDEPTPGDVSNVDVTADVAADVTADVTADAQPDVQPDVQPDAAADTGPDAIVVVNPHSCRDIGDLTYVPVDPDACPNSCLDENGKSKKTLCPDPISDWNCVTGCCLPAFVCETDADCLQYGYDEGQCADDRYDCRCDTAAGSCFNWHCAGDSECCGDESCDAGVCDVKPDLATLSIRIVSTVTVLSPGSSTTLLAEAYDPADANVVLDAGTVTWSSDNAGTVDVTDAAAGVVTGGTTAGEAVITVTAEGGATDTITLANVLPAVDATLTVITVIEGTLTPVSGRYALVDHSDGSVVTTDVIPADGIITTSAALPTGGFDVHVFGDGVDWITYLGAEGPVLYLPIPRTIYGEIELDDKAALVEAGTELIGTNILTGAPDYTSYPIQGEFEISLNSFALSSGLLDFNIDGLLGINVKRYFDPAFPLAGVVDVTQQTDIPGGLTFGLEGPAIPEFWLAAPGGTQTLWSLGGRAPFSEVSPYIGDIVGAVGGDNIDIGSIVTAVIPLFAKFYSAVTTGMEFPGDGSMAVTTTTPKLDVALSLTTSLTVPALPEVETGVWAEVIFMLTGALRVDGTFVPLGLNAGADTTDSELYPHDGLADSDIKTAEIDPYTLKYAPMHSGLAETSASYMSAVVALSIDPGGASTRKDGGSAVLYHAEAGKALPETLPSAEFLGMATGSAYDETTRAVTTVAPAGADATRMLFKSKKGVNWTVWLNGETSYTMPVPADLAGVPLDDRATGLQLLLTNCLDLKEGTTLADLAAPGGLTLERLLLVVDRVSFLDVRP